MTRITTDTPLILASGSPRRRELLAHMGVPFEVLPSHIDEPPPKPDEHPRAYALRLAYLKADATSKVAPPDRVVLAADTIVILDEEVLGKPTDRNDAHRMIRALAGRTHEVITGIAVGISGRMDMTLDAETTDVAFRPLTDNEIEDYLDRDEYADKAGAYGIQGAASPLIRGIRGDYFNVVGFPCELVARLIAPFWDGVPSLPSSPLSSIGPPGSL